MRPPASINDDISSTPYNNCPSLSSTPSLEQNTPPIKQGRYNETAHAVSSCRWKLFDQLINIGRKYLTIFKSMVM